MKKILSLFIGIVTILSYNAQVISLEQALVCRDNPGTCAEYTYAKDINNSLDSYVGTWKGSYNGKNYEFNFIKKLAQGDLTKWDELIGRLKVTDNNGNVIYSSFDKPDDKTLIEGLNFVNSSFKMYSMSYSINATCNDSGRLYLTSKPNIPNQLSLSFWREPDLVDLNKCPNIKTYVTLIPKDIPIVLTKQ